MTLAEIRPYGDRLLVRPDAKHATTDGGLAIPQSVLADNPNWFNMTGTVIKIGDGVREDVYQCVNHQCRYECRRAVGERCPICGAVQRLMQAGEVHAFDVAVGDRVMFGRFAGKQIEVDDDVMAFDVVCGVGVVGGAGGMRLESQKQRYLMMREIEVIGVLTGDEKVLPGYEAANWSKPTAGLTPVVLDRE